MSRTLLNGGYGALGNSSFLYYKVENAEAITTAGQLVNKVVSNKTNKLLQTMFGSKRNMWVYSDTDSCYLTLVDFVSTLKYKDIQTIVDTVDRFYKEILSPQIEKYCQEICDYMNCYEQRMFWEREVIADKGIWIAKKKYVLSVLDSEGTRYKEPKIKITGMESKKAAFPQWSRDALIESYKYGLEQDKTSFYQNLEKVRNTFYKMSPDDIAIPTRVNGLEKYHDPDKIYAKGAQAHVKAALFHNHVLRERDIRTIPPINSGDSIKYLPLKIPNPLNSFEVIGFDTFLPREFGLEKHIDKDVLFDKSFMAPLRIFLKSIDWPEEEQVSLF